MKLEDFISKRLQIGRRSARALILDGKVTHRGAPTEDHRCEVTRFDEVTVGGKILRAPCPDST